MRVTHAAAALSAAVVLNAAVAGAADGVLIAQKTTSATGGVSTGQVQIEKTRMRAEGTSANGRRQTFIFDGTAQVMRTIDDEAKTYSEVTKADIDRLSGQMSGAMAQMQEQMKNMPPEARARMEEMMKGRGMAMPGSAPAAATTEYKKVGTDKVGKWSCDKYEGTRGGQKVSEVCTVAPSALGFNTSDFEVTKQMAEFFSKLIPQGADQLFRIGADTPNGFSGVPVRTVTYRNGAPAGTSEITDVTRQNFPDSIFAVPAGYEKRDMMGGRGRGRGL
jgi:hypothetical protein